MAKLTDLPWLAECKMPLRKVEFTKSRKAMAAVETATCDLRQLHKRTQLGYVRHAAFANPSPCWLTAHA